MNKLCHCHLKGVAAPITLSLMIIDKCAIAVSIQRPAVSSPLNTKSCCRHINATFKKMVAAYAALPGQKNLPSYRVSL